MNVLRYGLQKIPIHFKIKKLKLFKDEKMIPTQTPNQIMYRHKAATAQLNPVQSALAFSFITYDPKVQPIAGRILGSMNTVLQVALLLKSISYLTGLKITVISAFSLTALLAATVIGLVGGILIAIASKKLVTRWLEDRVEKYGPLREPNTKAKYQLQDKLRALNQTLTKFVPKWKEFITTGQAQAVRNLFEHPNFASTYTYTNEQYQELGDQFEQAYKAFREGALQACATMRLTDRKFDQLVINKVGPLQTAINQKIEFFLFPDDLKVLSAYKSGLFDYLKSKVEQFPDEENATRTQITRLTCRYHPDTGETADPELMTLIQQAATLFPIWQRISLGYLFTGETKGIWITDNDYRTLRDVRQNIENALATKGDLTIPKGMALPLPLFALEAGQYLATVNLASR